MERRRGVPVRPASDEGELPRLALEKELSIKTWLSEVECWEHASESLSRLSNVYASAATIETIGRLNRLITAWPTDDTPPAEGIGHMKTVQQKLTSGLSDIIDACDQEVK